MACPEQFWHFKNGCNGYGNSRADITCQEQIWHVVHWLLVLQRYHYKLCLLVYKCLYLSVPSYLIDQCVPVVNDTSRERLRSASHGYLTCPCTKRVRYSDHSFVVSGPKICNQLPVDLRDPSLSLHQFTKKLKTVLFQQEYYA